MWILSDVLSFSVRKFCYAILQSCSFSEHCNPIRIFLIGELVKAFVLWQLFYDQMLARRTLLESSFFRKLAKLNFQVTFHTFDYGAFMVINLVAHS